MATNPPPDDNRRMGAVRKKSQFQHPNKHWTTRNAEDGRFMDVKADKNRLKDVRREKRTRIRVRRPV
ncbi:MAG: hypothetical protein IH999_01810 [Proteobacteria bacterium]|nr:hypothetical protein [Pseudomonadota bacterium]